MNALHIYKSSAGSGKTFTLVKEYLKIVLQSPSAYRHTLAITFTNKATAEMKERIITALVQLSEDQNPQLKLILETEINNSKINIIERAQHVLKLIFHDYANFGISTIDSFFSRIIRSLAKEMQLPLKFEMEMNQEFIATQLTEMLISDVGKSVLLTQWLKQFVFDKMENEKGWNIDNEIKTVAKEVFKNREPDTPESNKISLEFIDQLKKIKYSFENYLKQLANEFFEITGSANLTIGDFSNDKRGVAGYFIKIVEGQTGDKIIPGKRAQEAAISSEIWVTKKSPKREEIIALAETHLMPLLQKALSYHNSNFKKYISACEVLSVAYMAGILNYLHEKMAQYRDEHDVLLMSDMNVLLKKFITGNDTPFIYEKTGNKYLNYLIDEFQDTADLQWDNLLPLVINGLGSGGMVMLVGDAKQSIYRWRGGNPKLILEQINRDLHYFSSVKTTFNLDTNYRSLKAVVDFNNHFFSLAPRFLNLSDPSLLNLAYFEKDTRQQSTQDKSTGGFVSVSLFPKEIKLEEEGNSNWQIFALKKTTDTIELLVNLGYNLQDIALLTRTNKDGKTIADHLFAHGYKKIASADSLKLHTAPQIIFLVNILHITAWPDNQTALAEVTYYYQKYILHHDVVENHDIFNSAGDKNSEKRAAFLPAGWLKQKDNLVTLPIYELVEKLVAMFGLNTFPDAYIQRFQDMILTYSFKNKPSVKDFLVWWEEHKASDKYTVVTPKDKDAINIVSIHKSKGLQFPVVIIPFSEWSLVPKPNELLWITSDEEPYNQAGEFPVKTNKILAETFFAHSMEEETDQSYLDNLNLLYVAFTRAEEKLYVFSVDYDSDDKAITLVSKLLSAVLTTAESTKLIHPDTGIITYEYGENGPKTESKLTKKVNLSDFENPENIALTEYPINTWQEKISVRIAVSNIMDTVKTGIHSATDNGLLLHSLMAQIKLKNDKEKALEKTIASNFLNSGQAELLRKELELVFTLTDEENWFDNQWLILNEVEIGDPEGNLIRPDRVMINGKNAIVLDYKTGVFDQKHKQQVIDYAQTLKRMGFSDVKAYLLYLHDKKLMTVMV